MLDEVAGGWLFRTNAQYAPFVRELAGGSPVRLTRAQIETLAIMAYRQPITRPEIDDIRGVDSGATLKLLLERDLVRILGKKDEPGRPLLYGTTTQFLEFFGLKSLKDLPTLREFTELTTSRGASPRRSSGRVRGSRGSNFEAPAASNDGSPEPSGADDARPRGRRERRGRAARGDVGAEPPRPTATRTGRARPSGRRQPIRPPGRTTRSTSARSLVSLGRAGYGCP